MPVKARSPKGKGKGKGRKSPRKIKGGISTRGIKAKVKAKANKEKRARKERKMYDPLLQAKKDAAAHRQAARKRAAAGKKKKKSVKKGAVTRGGKGKKSCYATLSACDKLLKTQREVNKLANQYYELLDSVERQLAYALRSQDPAQWRRAEKAMEAMNAIYRKKEEYDKLVEGQGGYREKCIDYMTTHKGVCTLATVKVKGTGPKGRKLGGKLKHRVLPLTGKRKSKSPARKSPARKSPVRAHKTAETAAEKQR